MLGLLVFTFLLTTPILATTPNQPPPGMPRNIWNSLTPQRRIEAWDFHNTYLARPSEEQLRELMTQIEETRLIAQYRAGLLSYIDITPLHTPLGMQMLSDLSMTEQEFRNLGRLQHEVRENWVISNFGSPITHEELLRLREQYGSRDITYLYQTLSDLITFYREQLGMGPVAINGRVNRFAQEHADLWQDAIDSGLIDRTSGLRNTQTNRTIPSVHYRPTGESLSIRVAHQVSQLQRDGYGYVNRGSENISGSAPRLLRTEDLLLPGIVEAVAYSLLFSNSFPHFRNLFSLYQSTEQNPMLIGLGYTDNMAVLKFFGQ